MEDIYPEIALKQPKSDPRTVLLHKRYFMESSSDHIQEEFLKNSSQPLTAATTANCDKFKNIKYENSSATTSAALAATSSSPSSTATNLVFKTSLVSSSSSSSSSLLSSYLVNFSKSCHFNASLNNFNKLQKTKLLFLLFIWCAIYLQTTQAIPVQRTTSGRKLILHSNVNRDRQHQKLLEGQKQHNQQQQQLQLQIQKEQQHQEQLLQLKKYQQHYQQLLLQPPQLNYPKQQQQQQQQPPQVQKNHIYSPTKILRRIHPQHHRHHLHQRAAPSVTNISQYKMNYCNGNEVYKNLHNQINGSLGTIKGSYTTHLQLRGNDTYEQMSETWKLWNLEIKNPDRKPVNIENELHKNIHEFYLNLHNFDQLIDYAYQDTIGKKAEITHQYNTEIYDKILEFFEKVKNQINFNMQEAERLLNEKPVLTDNIVKFKPIDSERVRDFLIIKNLIEELERISVLIQEYCQEQEEE